MTEDGVAVGTPVGGYVARGLLGRGGMAEVYRVEAPSGQAFALKLLHSALPGLTERLRLEGEVQKQLRHPNLVAVFGTLMHQGRPGLLMELVDGPSLEARLGEGPLPMALCDTLAEGLFAGVAFAHRAGVLHRDLKPANVLLATGPDGQIVPKVGDFGLVKRLDDPGAGAGTRTGTAMGTPCYMPPEQLRDAKSVDERADVFALGVILYELTTGVRPWESDDLIALYHRMVEGPERPARALRPELAPRMARAIDAALAPDRDARCASVHELAAIWRGTLIPAPVVRAPETLEAPPIDLFDRIDPARDHALGPRRRGAQVGVAVGVVVLTALVGGLGWRALGPGAPAVVAAPPPLPPVRASEPAPPPRPRARVVPAPTAAITAPVAGIEAPAPAPEAVEEVEVGVMPAETDAPSAPTGTPKVDTRPDGG